MPDRDLQLNSLARYSKQSPRLVLEEYSNCEVPAGCGGVVLRWRKPTEPIPLHVSSGYTGNGRWDGEFIDGNKFWRGRAPVNYGTHVLALHIVDIDPAYAIVLMVIQVYANYLRILQPEGDVKILSIPDGTWKCSLEELEDTRWQQPDFDDSDWAPMIEKPFNRHIEHFRGDPSSLTKDETDQGAVGLGIDTTHPTIARQMAHWQSREHLPAIRVRRVFNLQKDKAPESQEA